MKAYEYFVDDNTGMACVVDTTYSFQDEADLMDYAENAGWELNKIDAPAYAYDEDGELKSLCVW